jgi:radical SAM protein with 4Fe4S-binding SPASM domain
MGTDDKMEFKIGEFHIQWHITDKCNLRCIHCYQDVFTSKNELNWHGLLVVINNIIQTIKKWDACISITLTGGEPLLKHELWRLLEYLAKINEVYELNIITNGMVIELYIEHIISSPIANIFVSLDGVSAEINDSIRGKGSFQKVVNNIRLLKSYGNTIIIMFTLLRRNIEDAVKLLQFCRQLGVDGYIIERFVPLGYGRQILSEVVSGEFLNRLYQEIFNQCNVEYNPEEAVKYRALQVRFDNNNNIELYGAECIVGRHGIAVLPDGTVLPCRRFYLPIGNLQVQTLDEIWQSSDVLNNLRDKNNLYGKCRTCRISNCYGCRAMVYALTGDYMAEDLHCILKK